MKYGAGCFNKTYDNGVTLAHLLCATSRGMGIETTCFVTNMNVPLGRTVGNGLEVIESLDILKGGGPKDVIELVTSQGNSSKLYVAWRVTLDESCFIRSTLGPSIMGGWNKRGDKETVEICKQSVEFIAWNGKTLAKAYWFDVYILS